MNCILLEYGAGAVDDCSLLLQFTKEKPKMTGRVDIFTYLNELMNQLVAVKQVEKGSITSDRVPGGFR